MSYELPIWVEYVKALATPIVAVAAAYITTKISMRQWRTANEKLVLDLFQKRWDIYQDVRDVMVEIEALGTNNITDEIVIKFSRARLKSAFMFGPDVHHYLQDINDRIIKARRAENRLKAAPQPALDSIVAQINEHEDRFASFFRRFDALVAPYMRMDFKLSSYTNIRYVSRK